MNCSQIKKQAKEILRRNFDELSTGNLLYHLLGGIIAAGCPLSIEIKHLYQKAIDGESFYALDIFKNYRKNFGRSVAAIFLIFIRVFIGFVIFVIPGIIASFKYSMTTYIMMREAETGSSEAMRKSKEMMNGKKFSLFLLYMSMIGWIILSVIIPPLMFITVPYIELSACIFMNDIYNNYLKQADAKGLGSDTVSGDNTVGMESKFCRYCGMEIPSDCTECPSCGMTL